MQDEFFKDEALIKKFIATLSTIRMQRYFITCGGDSGAAIKLYHWNTLLSQALYICLQTWEVTLRNRINLVLCSKFGQDWPFSETLIWHLTDKDKRQLEKSIERQCRHREIEKPTADMLVADLSVGFWLSALSSTYDVAYGWEENISAIFPYHKRINRENLNRALKRTASLRNKVAHHEAIFYLDLPARRASIGNMVAGMCPAAAAYMDWHCTFLKIWKQKPNRPT